jgi:hypothetical protein
VELFGLSDAALLKLRLALFALVALALAVLVLWYGEWRADTVRADLTQKHEAAILKQQVVAAKRLAEEVSYSQRIERALGDAQRNIEELGNERIKVAAEHEKRLAMAAGLNGGRLRDPNAAGCGGGGAKAPATPVAGPGAVDAAQAPGLLSAQLSGLLLRLQRDADSINDAYAVCRPDAINLREQLSPQP